MSLIGRVASRREALILGGLALGVGLLPSSAEAAPNHPKIRTAIADLRDARAYLKTAPSTFGGHKAEAVRKISLAIEELRICLRF